MLPRYGVECPVAMKAAGGPTCQHRDVAIVPATTLTNHLFKLATGLDQTVRLRPTHKNTCTVPSDHHGTHSGNDIYNTR